MIRIALLTMAVSVLPMKAAAENLYNPNTAQSLTSDVKASAVGDILTVIIVQSAEARNSARNLSSRDSGAGASANGTDFGEFIDFNIGNDFTGLGEVRRSESFVTQMSATVQAVYPNGDLQIAGAQFMRINGETTQIDIMGRVRTYDISPDNTVLSSRIADARIQYDGEGFVSDSARPGLVARIFNALGL